MLGNHRSTDVSLKRFQGSAHFGSGPLMQPPLANRRSLLYSSWFDISHPYSNGASYAAASSIGIPTPKSIIQTPRGPWFRSMPLKYGRSTSLLGWPFGFRGSANHSCAFCAGMSKGPAGVTPMNESPRFSDSRRACVTSMAAVKLLLIMATGRPSSSRGFSEPASNPTIETCTVAPSNTQSRSDCAQKMSPVSLIRANTLRLAPPRIPCVANNPALFAFPATICARAFSNQ